MHNEFEGYIDPKDDVRQQVTDEYLKTKGVFPFIGKLMCTLKPNITLREEFASRNTGIIVEKLD